MENFDQFIRKHTEKELDMPIELDWDNMNIPLPTKKKEKKRKIFWILIFLLGVLVAIIGTSIYYNNHRNNQDSDAQEIVQTHAHDYNQESTDHASQDENAKTSILKKLLKDKKSDSVETLSPALGATTISKNTNDINQAKSMMSADTERAVLAKTTGQANIPHLGTKSRNDITEELDTKSKNSILDDQNIELLRAGKKGALAELQELLSKGELSVTLRPEYAIDSDKHFASLNTSKSKKISLYLAAGYLRARNHYSGGPQADALSESETSGHGTAANIGVRYLLDNSMFFISELSYQKFHYFFDYTEEKRSDPNPLSFGQFTTLRHICHNNYIESLGIKLGLGKKITLGRRWETSLTAALSTNYQLTANGRTLSEEHLVLDLDNHIFPERIIYAAHLDAGISYEINDFRLFGSMGMQYGINSTRVSVNSNLEYSPRALNISLGIAKRY